MEYTGSDTGPFRMAEMIGHHAVKELLQGYYEATGFDVYRPSALL